MLYQSQKRDSRALRFNEGDFINFGDLELFFPDFGQKDLEKHFLENSYFRLVRKCLLHLYFEYQGSGTSRSIEIAIRERYAQRHV